MTCISYQLKRVITPFEVDGLLANMLLLVPRIITGFLLAFVYAPVKFGTPWSPNSLKLELFEVADWFVIKVTEFGTPFNMMPEVFSWSAGFTIHGGIWRYSTSIGSKYSNNRLFYYHCNGHYDLF